MGNIHDISNIIRSRLIKAGFKVTSETGNDQKESSTLWKNNIRVQIRVEFREDKT